MDDNEARIVHDTIAMMKKHAPAMVGVLNSGGATPQQKSAYKSGVYAACVRLDALLTEGQKAACAAEDARRERELADFVAQTGVVPVGHPWPPDNEMAEHPDFPLAEWASEVSGGGTRLGYVEWVSCRLER